jgi:YidC/Oxa1 family membrane protein insertase
MKIPPQSLAKRLSSLKSLRLIGLASLALLVPILVGMGCQSNPLANIEVNTDYTQAVKDGEAKEKEAQDLETKGQLPDAEKAWIGTINYYNALAAKKFPTLATDQSAEADIHVMALKKATQISIDHRTMQYRNLDNNIRTLRHALREYPSEKYPKQHKEITDYIEEVSKSADEYYKQGKYLPWLGFISYSFLYSIMDGILSICKGNVVLAMSAIALFVTLFLWPLRHKQFKFAKELTDKMKVLQPEMTAINEKYKDDIALRSQKLQEFNKKHNIDLKGGCLPGIAQAPITYFMFMAISSYQYQFRDDHFLWINLLNGERSLTWTWPFTGFFGHHLGEPDILIVILYCLSLFTQIKINQTPTTDPMQAEQQRIMNLMMPAMYFMFATQTPSAFIIYWFLSNLLGFAQMKIIYKGLPDTVLPDIKEVGPVEAAKPLKANPKLVSPKRKK